MKDKDGKVIYVGKAKNLKSRVNSYFDRTWELTLAKKQMVWKITDIETILCETEVEALVLETNLIKHLIPKYNILMKDDKNFAYIKITNSPVPELVKTRIKVKDGSHYFGPYVSAVEQSVRALRRLFKIRNCRVKFSQKSVKFGSEEGGIEITDKAGKTLPCMDYYIWLCPAPCLLKKEAIQEHNDHLADVREFLEWKSQDTIDRLSLEMQVRAKNLEFEKAQELKVTIEWLKSLHERQKVRDVLEGNVDIFLKYEKYEKTYIALTQIRSSQIIWVFRHEVTLNAEDDYSLTSSFLMRQYLDNEDLPDFLLLSDIIWDEAFLEFLKNIKITIEYPQIWPKKELLEFTRNQLREYAYKREMETLENKTLKREHMFNILKALGYPAPKKWDIVFECYDISHTDGHFTYASRVTLINGRPDTSKYKKYKIKTLKDGDIDDFASHREVMTRRTVEWLLEWNFPHLIIIDGGKWQLSSAVSGVKEGIWKHQHENKIDTSVESVDMNTLIPICSIAKREEEIFLPGKKVPILFQKGTPELMVIQKARDESHRFSIWANKSARTKSMKKNILEEIPSIWPITRKKLLKIAGSVDAIKNLELEELEKIVTKSQLQALQDHALI
jgi:excinuclease ABC subunit C